MVFDHIKMMDIREELKEKNKLEDDYTEIAKGICFGSGAGIIFGAILGNVVLGLSGGGVLGIIIGFIIRVCKNTKRV